MVAVSTETVCGQAQPKASFGKQAGMHLQYYSAASDRDLFYCLINIDEFPSVGPQAQHTVEQTLAKAQALIDSPATLPAHLQAFDYTADAFAERLNTLHQQQRAILTPDRVQSDAQLQYVLKQYAPAAFIDGCWLQNISIAPNNHTEINTRLFHIYAEKIGDGDTAKHYGNLYQCLLNSADINLPAVNSRLFMAHRDLCDKAFTAPVFQLALSLFPRVYLAEIIGFTLGHFFAAQNRLLFNLGEELSRRELDDRYCQRYALTDKPSRDAQLIRDVVVYYLNTFKDADEQQAQWQRIWRGLVSHTVVNADWMADLQDAVHHPRILTPHQKMLALVREKAPHARNMHRKRKLGGQRIDEWFDQEPFDAEGFLKVLADSPFVNRKSPLESRLINQSIEFSGPMFRIFTDAEQAVMREWILSLSEEQTAETAVLQTSSRTAFNPIHRDDDNDPDLATYAGCNKRQLYFYFVNADLYPDILPTARKVAQQYFKQARAELNKRNLDESLRLFPYSYDALQARINQIYDAEISAYELFEAPSTVPREVMVWFIQQYAPFPMVDGSWVQHIARAGISHTEISARLFRIYSDEVGNADTTLNHPNVYRLMLEAEGIHMPPTDSMEFVMQPSLQSFAFDLPLLTLSVSMFPRTFLPEIIGVNLAIELSGLGKNYMQIIDELNYWKIDPYFFKLHLTIDNIASGHTAVAIETVHLYLDQILTMQGQAAMQSEWERIWVGYLTFKQCITRFDTTLERQATFRFMIPLIRQNLKRGRLNKRQSIIKAG